MLFGKIIMSLIITGLLGIFTGHHIYILRDGYWDKWERVGLLIFIIIIVLVILLTNTGIWLTKWR